MTAANVALNIGKTVGLPLLKQYGPQIMEKVIVPFAKQKYTEFLARRSGKNLLAPVEEYRIINEGSE